MAHCTRPSLAGKTVLITGAARRIGAAMARTLHAAGMNIILHYRDSHAAAETLAKELEATRPDSVRILQAELRDTQPLRTLVEQAVACWGRLDVLINNASTFYATKVGEADDAHWNDLLGVNLKAPFFLLQAAAPYLQTHGGCVVNLADIHGDRPLKGYPVYSLAKAGMAMLTRSMARELAPNVRVNAIAPGAIMWPEAQPDEARQQEIIERTALKRAGSPADIADTALFLIRDAGYITGQIIAVEGGRTLSN